MIRILLFYWHRLRADTWRRRAGAAMAEARTQFVAARLYGHRAEGHDDRAEALYPARSTGPPDGGGADRDGP